VCITAMINHNFLNLAFVFSTFVTCLTKMILMSLKMMDPKFSIHSSRHLSFYNPVCMCKTVLVI